MGKRRAAADEREVEGDGWRGKELKAPEGRAMVARGGASYNVSWLRDV
jgi:hypothetical protein